MLHISSFIKNDLDRQGKLPAKWHPELPDSPITDKCFIYVDAINNTGSGHSNSATSWKNLMGGTNGTKVGTVSWQDDALVLTRSSSTANGFRFMVNNASAITMEAVFELAAYPLYEAGNGLWEGSILSCAQSGGANISCAGAHHNSLIACCVSSTASGSVNHFITGSNACPLNKKIYVAFTADQSEATAMSSLNSVYFKSPCKLKYTYNTPWSVGFNPNPNSPYYSTKGWGQLVGKVYSVRVHSRVLTPDEIRKNMLYERNRYNF